MTHAGNTAVNLDKLCCWAAKLTVSVTKSSGCITTVLFSQPRNKDVRFESLQLGTAIKYAALSPLAAASNLPAQLREL